VNTNLFHNIANVASLALAGATAMLLASGCSQNVDSLFDCSQSWINPTYTTAAVAGLQGIKLVVNILRDGFAGLVKQQPPVRKRRRHGKGEGGPGDARRTLAVRREECRRPDVRERQAAISRPADSRSKSGTPVIVMTRSDGAPRRWWGARAPPTRPVRRAFDAPNWQARPRARERSHGLREANHPCVRGWIASSQGLLAMTGKQPLCPSPAQVKRE
jgi:hypothetical protein